MCDRKRKLRRKTETKCAQQRRYCFAKCGKKKLRQKLRPFDFVKTRWNSVCVYRIFLSVYDFCTVKIYFYIYSFSKTQNLVKINVKNGIFMFQRTPLIQFAHCLSFFIFTSLLAFFFVICIDVAGICFAIRVLWSQPKTKKTHSKPFACNRMRKKLNAQKVIWFVIESKCFRRCEFRE